MAKFIRIGKQQFRKGLLKKEFLSAVVSKSVGMDEEKAYELYKSLSKKK